MIKLRHIITLFCFCLSMGAIAQPKDAKIVELDNGKFYKYKVEKGKTLYGISKTYNVGIDEIEKYNPEIKDGLKKGQVIYIPVPGQQNISDTSTGTSSNYIHTVAQGETVYGICKQYNISQSDLLESNPQARNGLQIGQKLIIPGLSKGNNTGSLEKNDGENLHTTSLRGDSIVRHVVQKGETLYSLSKRYMISSSKIKANNGNLPGGLKVNDTLTIPVRSEVAHMLNKEISPGGDDSVKLSDATFKDSYNVVLLMPLQLDRNALKERKRTPTSERELLLTTKIGVDFYAGALLALDSLKQKGVSVKFNVYDTGGNDTTLISKILKKDELQQADLIIGPFYSENVRKVSVFAKKEQIHMVIPVPQGNKVLYRNPYVSKAVTSTTTQLKKMAKYVVDTYPDANIILVDSKLKKEAYMFNVMKRELTEQLSAHFGKPMEPKLSYVQNYNANHLKGLVNKEKLNIIIACSRNKGFATNFMTKANSIKNSWDKFSADLMVFALSDWKKMNSIDELYKSKLKLHYVANSHVNHDTITTKKFLHNFRHKFGYDPDDMGFMGFDLTYNYVAALANFGSRFNNSLALIHAKGVHTNIDVKQVQEGSGFENQSAFIIRYEGYVLKCIELE